MSPRTQEKNRLINLIKSHFSNPINIGNPLKTTPDFYRIGKLLGKGAFGRVNLAMHKVTESLVAVKSINKQYLSENEGGGGEP
jgi:serine/threonine protein kinase